MASVFHAGEIAVQRQAGTYQGAGRIGNGIRSTIPDSFGAFMAEQVLAVAASVDSAGAPWASILVGAPGFLHTLNQHTLQINTQPIAGDPLVANLSATGTLGLLVIDFATRGRIRLNGRATSTACGLQLQTAEVFGNCQKYIQAREWVSDSTVVPTPAQAIHNNTITAGQTELIRAADTFFIASAHPRGGVDASHRGGMPGFVRVVDAQTLVWPDYSGNGMFQTLGNLALNPHAGLLFIDFERGNVLQLTGTTEIIWDQGRLAEYAGAERLVILHVEQAIEIANALPLRCTFQNYSRFNPR